MQIIYNKRKMKSNLVLSTFQKDPLTRGPLSLSPSHFILNKCFVSNLVIYKKKKNKATKLSLVLFHAFFHLFKYNLTGKKCKS